MGFFYRKILLTPDSGHFGFFSVTLGRMSEVLFVTIYLKLSVCFSRKFPVQCKYYVIFFKNCYIVVAIEK